MQGFNKVILAGNLTRDPELAYTPKGTAVVKGGLALNRKWRTESGEEREEVTFVDFEAWGKTAETIGQYCRKGHNFMLEGRLKLDQWEDKQTGEKKSKLKVVLESFTFLPNGEQQGGGQQRQERPPAQERTERPHTPSYRQPADDMPPREEDNVPF